MSFVPVTRLEVSLDLGGAVRPVGRLARVERRYLFEYDPAFLADPLPLSPAHLPTRSGVFEGPAGVFEGLHGLFQDSLPDTWGRLLLDREMDRRGVGREQLGALDRLARVGREGWGALCYAPVLDDGPTPSLLDLPALAAEARGVLDGAPASLGLYRLGASSGGARPKVQVGLRRADGALWPSPGPVPDGFVPVIVKFGATEDPPDMGPLEMAYADMARAAGIEVPPTWLLAVGKGQPGFFAIQRFDRGPRRHVHSLSGLLHADPRLPSVDYEQVLRATRWLTRDQRVVDRMYLRAAFNVVAHVRDDHSRNLAFRLSDKGEWDLAPGYDLVFAPGPGGEHWMAVMGEGRAPGRSHLLALAKKVGVPPKTAVSLIEHARAAVADWPTHAARWGVTAATQASVGRALGRTLAATAG